MNARPHLITTAPRRSTCDRCKRVVLDGIADGMPYRADAIPLNALGEVHARLAGRNCYRLLASRLVHRDHHDIANDTRRGRPPVAAAHSCAPIDPAHVDPAHVAAFVGLTSDPTPVATEAQDVEQHALFILTGALAGTTVIAVPADDDLVPPF